MELVATCRRRRAELYGGYAFPLYRRPTVVENLLDNDDVGDLPVVEFRYCLGGTEWNWLQHVEDEEQNFTEATLFLCIEGQQ
mmetsp:Transcript_50909/g.76116  ORF Transcript_50909/g.76116 Transcript_50909/m.76116 type:complete len:82 (+) Transcript_50909:90-335(+)